jgi:hypothetical protein
MRTSLLLLACGWVCLAQTAKLPERNEEVGPQLLEVKRLFIDKFSGGETSVQLRDMVISSLQRTKLFVITENPDRADAILRGSAEDLIYTDTFQSSEGVNARISVHSGESTNSKTRDYSGIGTSIGEQESSRIAERKHEASASVRIINKDGDVIWSTMQESPGGKFRSASADVADRISKQLVADMQRLKGIPASALAVLPTPPQK